MSAESLERLIPAFWALTRKTREGRVPNVALHDTTLGLQFVLTQSIVQNPGATQNDLRVAKGELEGLLREMRRIFGTQHPRVRLVERLIELANRQLSS